MCPICGTLLELAESPQAQRERVLVKRLIAEGKTKAEVKDALVAQYGPAVLALPEGSGFDLSAYLVPVIAFVAAGVALAFGVLRWRRAAKPPGAGRRLGERPAGRGRRTAGRRSRPLRPLSAGSPLLDHKTGTGPGRLGGGVRSRRPGEGDLGDGHRRERLPATRPGGGPVDHKQLVGLTEARRRPGRIAPSRARQRRQPPADPRPHRPTARSPRRNPVRPAPPA